MAALPSVAHPTATSPSISASPVHTVTAPAPSSLFSNLLSISTVLLFIYLLVLYYKVNFDKEHMAPTSNSSGPRITGSAFSPFSSPPPIYKISSVGGVTVRIPLSMLLFNFFLPSHLFFSHSSRKIVSLTEQDFGRPLTSVIGEVGGIKLCFPFLDMGPAQQVAGLRILVGLLSRSDTNKAQFRKLNGFCILYYLLCRFELSMETFDVIFDLLYDGFTSTAPSVPITPLGTLTHSHHLPSPEWTHDGLTLLLDLLTSSSCNDELQRHVLKCVARMVGASTEALRLWTSGRLFSLLQLTSKLTTGILSNSYTNIIFKK